MSLENVLDVNDPRAEDSADPLAILVNVKTGRIREIRCGPKEAAHFSGARLVYWDRHQGRAEIPKKHAKTWRFYKDFCSDPDVAKACGLTVRDSAAYHQAYVEFVSLRGAGAKAKHIKYTDEQLRALWHPALLALREENEAARGQERIDPAALDAITNKLKRPTK